MPLPDNNTLHSRAKSNTSNNPHPSPKRSYADAAKRDIPLTRRPTTRHSLLNLAAAVTIDAKSETIMIQTRIWRHSLAPRGYFLDISKIPHLTDEQHFDEILIRNYSHDFFYGLKALGSRTTGRYIELNPIPEIEEKFSKEGV
ncbi:hypothetical protein G6F46_013958 [Rhizopus delemar]|nr:hypothetical protein G6F55_008660 [Rhizopus delemar]KAG1538420.1 hypothetical protein G6F51_009781 [Rhizopus arrhizus]KAG1482793.1 hypothetical protein G6F54_013603 [Rhizopus delemar]KAG1488109.1 hypothetical protein G6F53_013636 [Rhizopus delemar]KAG1519949.1 hypothetical protein G6F52_008128 [Rhizopus delemar]